MTSSSKAELILPGQAGAHTIKKYAFKTLENQVSDDLLDNTPDPKTPPENFQKDLMNALLSKVDELSTSLANVQLDLQNQEKSLNEKIALERDAAYKKGYADGETAIKSALETGVREKEKAFLASVISLDEFLSVGKKNLQILENDLSEIALSLAETVISREVEQNSEKIALSLAKSLLAGVGEAVAAEIIVSPADYDFLRANFIAKNVKITASDAINPGGVVLKCALGEMQGDLWRRFEMLRENLRKIPQKTSDDATV